MLPDKILRKLTLDQGGKAMMVFKITNPLNGKSTHTAVGKFMSVVEDIVVMPRWVSNQLDVELLGKVVIKPVVLPKGDTAKLQAQSLDILKVKDLETLLIVRLSRYQCLTQGDIISILDESNKNEIKFKVVELNPKEEAVNINDVDLKVDFDTPVGYQPENLEKSEAAPVDRSQLVAPTMMYISFMFVGGI